jgi:hypothetical protein
MTKEEIQEVRKYFHKYSDKPYNDVYWTGRDLPAEFFYHMEEEFHIVIFKEDNSVYQLNSDHETQGIELEKLEDLRIRFRSFTGNELEDVGPVIKALYDEIDEPKTEAKDDLGNCMDILTNALNKEKNKGKENE